MSLIYSTNLAIILVMMQVSKKIAFEDPDVLFLVRCLYIASNAIILGIYLYTQSKINQKKGMLFPFLTEAFELHLRWGTNQRY